MSVRYAEELNSGQSSVLLQRADRQGFWDKSLQIFKCLCAHGRQGVRRMAQQTGLTKSSVHRLTRPWRAGTSIQSLGCGKPQRAASG